MILNTAEFGIVWKTQPKTELCFYFKDFSDPLRTDHRCTKMNRKHVVFDLALLLEQGTPCRETLLKDSVICTKKKYSAKLRKGSVSSRLIVLSSLGRVLCQADSQC